MAFRKALKGTAIIGTGAAAALLGLSQLSEYRKTQVGLGHCDDVVGCISHNLLVFCKLVFLILVWILSLYAALRTITFSNLIFMLPRLW